jgi:hypothetical protein
MKDELVDVVKRKRLHPPSLPPISFRYFYKESRRHPGREKK